MIPGPSVTPALEDEMAAIAAALARRLSVPAGCSTSSSRSGTACCYVLEANPRASRTVPFVAKATGVPLVDHACRLMLGEPLCDLGLPDRARPTRAWAKEAVFPDDRFPAPPTARLRCTRPVR